MTGVAGAFSVKAEHIEPARALHPNVRDDQVVAAVARLRPFDCSGAVVDGIDLIPFAAQDLAQQIARDAIVLGHQHARR